MLMTHDKKSALTFPCDFPIKIFGIASEEFEDAVLKIIKKYNPDLKETAINKRPSKDGKYFALTVLVYVDSQEKLDSIYQDLTASPLVLMSL
jgi:putative lipoic acid-binding regulatory protein